MGCWINGNKCPYDFKNFLDVRTSWCEKCQNFNEDVEIDLSQLVSEFNEMETNTLLKVAEFLDNNSKEFLDWLEEKKDKLVISLDQKEKIDAEYLLLKNSFDEFNQLIEVIKNF